MPSDSGRGGADGKRETGVRAYLNVASRGKSLGRVPQIGVARSRAGALGSTGDAVPPVRRLRAPAPSHLAARLLLGRLFALLLGGRLSSVRGDDGGKDNSC